MDVLQLAVLLAACMLATTASSPTAAKKAATEDLDKVIKESREVGEALNAMRSVARLFSPSAELHEMIKSLSSKNANHEESELLPAALKQQLLGGLQLWGSPAGHFGHTGGVVIHVRPHPRRGPKSVDMHLSLPHVHRDSLITQVIGNHVVVRGNLNVNGHHSAFQRAFNLPQGVAPESVQGIFHPVKEMLVLRFPGMSLHERSASSADSGLGAWDEFLKKVTSTVDAPEISPQLLSQVQGRPGALRGGGPPDLSGMLGAALANLVSGAFSEMFDDVKAKSNEPGTQPVAVVPSSMSLKEFSEGRHPSYGSPHFWRVVEDESEHRKPTRIDVKLRYPKHMKRSGLAMSVQGRGQKIELLKHIPASKVVSSSDHKAPTYAVPISHIKIPFKLKNSQGPLHSRAEGDQHVAASFAIPKESPVHHVPIVPYKDEL